MNLNQIHTSVSFTSRFPRGCKPIWILAHSFVLHFWLCGLFTKYLAYSHLSACLRRRSGGWLAVQQQLRLNLCCCQSYDPEYKLRTLKNSGMNIARRSLLEICDVLITILISNLWKTQRLRMQEVTSTDAMSMNRTRATSSCSKSRIRKLLGCCDFHALSL